MNILFLYLDAFRQTGGIEKFNKAFLKALDDISTENKIDYKAFSLCDDKPDTRYVNADKHKGFRYNKFTFVINSIREGLKADVVIIGHLNLALVGLIVKFFKPNKKVILVAHGIEIWNEQPFIKSELIRKADLILAVSRFTKDNIVKHNNISDDKVKIFHNTLDPYFNLPTQKEKPKYLLERYGLSVETKIILTITRINKFEGYKGYDMVIRALQDIIKDFPDIKYILVGKFDTVEERRLKNLVMQNNLDNNFILTGFIKEEELVDHYLLADVFVMPSKKEGFGIVFIEAAACGLPVIAGNKDGSSDALLDGRLGRCVDPDSITEISIAIGDMLKEAKSNNQNLIIGNFGFAEFKLRLHKFLFLT